MGQACGSAGLRSAGPGVSGHPRGPIRSAVGLSIPEERRRKETKLSRPLPRGAEQKRQSSPVCSSEGTVPPVDSWSRTARNERYSSATGCLGEARRMRIDRSAGCGRCGAVETARTRRRDAGGDGALRGLATVKQSGVSQLRLSVVQAKDSSAMFRTLCANNR